jgi:hypothetical protein
VAVRLLDAGMPAVQSDAGAVDPQMAELRTQVVEVPVRIEVLDRHHVGDVDGPPLVVVAEERSLRQRLRIDIPRAEPRHEVGQRDQR